MIRTDKATLQRMLDEALVAPALKQQLIDLDEKAFDLMKQKSFKQELSALLNEHLQRPTPLVKAEKLSEKYGVEVWLKREDLGKTGSFHAINALAQVFLARHLGKTHVMAETGTGEHGVAVARACWTFKVPCTIYMGSKDMKRQAANVQRIGEYKARLMPIEQGAQTVKDALDVLMNDWEKEAKDIYWVPGSAYGPHPYPALVGFFQSVLGYELKDQCLKQFGVCPTHVMAETGRGGTGVGVFSAFMYDPVQMVGAQPSGRGISTGKHAAAVLEGEEGMIHGMKTRLVKNAAGQTASHCIAPGMDYPAADPFYLQLADQKLGTFMAINDFEAMVAAYELMELENIVPSLETAHALALLKKNTFKAGDKVVICINSGQKDLPKYKAYEDVMR